MATDVALHAKPFNIELVFVIIVMRVYNPYIIPARGASRRSVYFTPFYGSPYSISSALLKHLFGIPFYAQPMFSSFAGFALTAMSRNTSIVLDAKINDGLNFSAFRTLFHKNTSKNGVTTRLGRDAPP